MKNSQNLGTIEAANPVLAVAPLKEETEMLRATDKITALYCRLSVEDMKEDKKGGKEDVSNSIQNQKMILLQYAKENRFPNPTFFVDDGYSGTNYDHTTSHIVYRSLTRGLAGNVRIHSLFRLSTPYRQISAVTTITQHGSAALIFAFERSGHLRRAC